MEFLAEVFVGFLYALVYCQSACEGENTILVWEKFPVLLNFHLVSKFQVLCHILIEILKEVQNRLLRQPEALGHRCKVFVIFKGLKHEPMSLPLKLGVLLRETPAPVGVRYTEAPCLHILDTALNQVSRLLVQWAKQGQKVLDSLI